MGSSEFQRLFEGNIYTFRIDGEVAGPDGEIYYKLADPNGVKHLLTKAPYHKYPFQSRMSIQCRIDRINCSGKIFIEPLHPVYELGKTYQFPLVRLEEILHSGKKSDRRAVLLDVFDHEINIPADDLPDSARVNDKITARVIRIKKGRIYISTDTDADLFTELSDGDINPFIIVDLKNYGEEYDFYVLEDEQSRQYKLRAKFYTGYGLKTGLQIRCRMVRQANDYYFEPLHPVYEPGGYYKFIVEGKKLIHNYPVGESCVIVLKNPYGKEITLPSDQTGMDIHAGDTITCRVNAIHKGEPELEVSPDQARKG